MSPVEPALCDPCRIPRREFLQWSIAGSLGFLAQSSWPEGSGNPSKKPNIILIVADDLGYADLGFQGGKEIPTPHLDSLAKNGVRFTNGYVSGPVCSPTRAGLMTGRYQQRFGHEFNPGAQFTNPETNEPIGLSTNEITVADLLKQAGYKTGMVGKWHLGEIEKFHPLKRGFEEYFGFLRGSHPYLDPSNSGNAPIYRGFEQVTEKDYLTDAFAREAVAYIDRHKSDPFFLYLTFNAVHTPLEAPARYLERFTHISDEKHRTYTAMLSAMDDAVGQVLGKLAEHGLSEDTLIFFISDNGGPSPANTSSNSPLRATKATVFEGGVRVPFLMHWPRALPKGYEYSKPVISLDILPTVVQAAGGTLPSDRPYDGVDLLPYVAGSKAESPHDTLCWRFGERRAIRQGDWKLVTIEEDDPQLFNLADDISETNDLASKFPEKVETLQAAFKQWEAPMIPPSWKHGHPRSRWQDDAEGRRPARRRRRNRPPAAPSD